MEGAISQDGGGDRCVCTVEEEPSCCHATAKHSRPTTPVTDETTADPTELQREIAASDAKFANIIPEDIALNTDM